MQEPPETFFEWEHLVPELRTLFADPPANPKKSLRIAIEIEKPEKHSGKAVPVITDRRLICVTDGEVFWPWEVESLRALFRGNRQPPVLGDFPEAYNDVFMLFDLHVLEISDCLGDRRDVEMKEIYSTLRRRPDGRSLGFVHDYFWRAAALTLGTRPLSQAEFEAIMARLERSCRTFEMGPSSRNYVAALRGTLGKSLYD